MMASTTANCGSDEVIGSTCRSVLPVLHTLTTARLPVPRHASGTITGPGLWICAPATTSEAKYIVIGLGAPGGGGADEGQIE